jgi:hypothetical protein
MLEVYSMGIEKTQLRELITQVLRYLDPEIPFSESAVELLMLTCAQESHLGTYIKQVGSGPARGIFQMEPNTERDLYANFLKLKPGLLAKIHAVTYDCSTPDDSLGNLTYQIAMARVHYFRSPRPIPADLYGWAAEWKRHYNTPLGAGTEDEAINNYKRLC